MRVPLLRIDVLAAIEQLKRLIENARGIGRVKKILDDFELPDGERIPLFTGMPPWAFAGPPSQSSDHAFGSSPTGLTDNKGIENALKQAKRDAGKARKRMLDKKNQDPEGWATFIQALMRDARSSKPTVRFNAKAMLAQLRRWGLL